MRTGFAVVAWLTLLTLLTASGSLMAGPETDFVPRPYWAGNNRTFAPSDRYRLSWHKWLTPATAADLRDPISGRVFSVEVDPAITVNISDSSLQFHGRGLLYRGANEAWSLGLKYRRLKLAPDLELLIKERTERPMVLKIEWSVALD